MPKTLINSFALITIISMVTMSCGKKAQEASESNPYVNPQVPELEAQLEKQELFCGGGVSSCPSYLAKIAVAVDGKLKYCTGFLVADDVLATASSCLPEKLRVKSTSCSKDVFVFFAKSREKPTMVNCSEVLEASNFQAKEPHLRRNDVAYLKLSQSMMKNRIITPQRKGMKDSDEFYTWAVDQIDAYQGIIRKSDNCKAIHHSYFNPLSVHDSSPVVTLAGCKFSYGNSGAPIIGYRDGVRGVTSLPVDEVEIATVKAMGILERELRPMFHVSNYACAPMYPDEAIINDNECSIALDISSYKSAQKDLLDEAKMFGPYINELLADINRESRNKYLKLMIKMVKEEDSYNLSIYPECYKNVSSWINTLDSKSFSFNVVYPETFVSITMTEFGKTRVTKETIGNSKMSFEFNPRILRTIRANGAPRRAGLNTWLNGNYNEYFAQMSEGCLLL